MKTASGIRLPPEANEFSKSDAEELLTKSASRDAELVNSSKITFLESKAGLGDRFRDNQNAPGLF